MCVALPMLVEAVDGYSLTVSRAGETKVVNALSSATMSSLMKW